jgi:hypothetical protein
MRQGADVAIRHLHPEFAMRLAAAIQEARETGLTEAGIFSAYRPPGYGVGGYSDKFNSLHSYGLAVDVNGIGGPASWQAELWHRVAATHGVACPYGPNHRVEWNHCQPTTVKIIRRESPLRETISADGPLNPSHMFEAGNALIESVAKVSNFVAPGTKLGDRDKTQSSALFRSDKADGCTIASTWLSKGEDASGFANEADRVVALASRLAPKRRTLKSKGLRITRKRPCEEIVGG